MKITIIFIVKNSKYKLKAFVIIIIERFWTSKSVLMGQIATVTRTVNTSYHKMTDDPFNG